MNFINVKLFLFIIIEVSSQFDNSDVGDSVQTDNIEDDFMGIDTIADNTLDDLASADYLLEERTPEIVGREYEGDTLRLANADPTLHKWKHQGPLFHSHSHTHTITHGTHLHEAPVVVHPVNYEFSHRPQSIYPPNNHQYVVVNEHGMEAPTRPLNLNSNQWSESSHQNAHLTYNQNFHQQNQAVHHQNIQFSNQNNHHFDSSGKVVHSWEAANPKIVNINGHSNTFIHSGTSQNFISSQNARGLEADYVGSPSDDHVVGISMPPEEQVHWQVKQGNSQLMSNSEDLIRPVVYDSGMNKILEVLDERSFYQTRPETSGNAKHAEISTADQPNDELASYQFAEYEGQKQLTPHAETADEAPNDPYLGNIIQIPTNNRCHCYRRRNSRNRRSPKLINMNVLSDNSMNFNISSLKLKEMNSKLNDTLFGYRNVVDDYRKKITDKRELLFADVLDSIIGNFQFRGYKDSDELKKREKRSATITKLLNNPDARLDVPKTLENIGIITRNAFEDERSPMYHVRQFMGSTKNAVLSAMKIPPQNLVIPSNYEIKNINPEEIEEEEDDLVSGINPKILSRSGFKNADENFEEAYPNDPYGIVETFARVGGAIRDSVRSGQNTLNHISNIAHDARKIYHTTKNTVPRVLLPYAKAPVLTSRFKANKKAPLKKAIIISPKVLDVKDPLIGAQQTQSDFVSMGHILDAIGLTQSKKDHIDLEKIVVKMPGEGETRGIYIPPIGDVKSVNGRKLPNFKEDNEPTKGKTIKNLGRIHDKIVSTNRVVKENMQKIKNDISKNLDKTKNKIKYGTQQLKERNNIENDSDILSQSLTRSDKSNIKANANEIKQFTKEEENEIIDKFLYNIFKTDRNQSAAIVSVNNMKKNERANYEMNTNSKQNTESTLGSTNIIYSSDILPNITKSILEETIKNITMDLIQDENKKDNYNEKFIKTNTIQKNYSNKKKKFLKRPKIVLQSRFGDDEDSTPAVLNRANEDIAENEDQVTDTTKPNITPQFKGLDKNEEEAMRKVDEYVLNDVALTDSSNNEKGKNSWKIDNVLELIEDPSAEESSNELKSQENKEEENVPVFASRSLLSVLDAADRQYKDLNRKKRSTDNEETVGLNLAPELMKPFMAAAPNSNIDKVYGYDDEDNEDNDVKNITEPNSPTTNFQNSDTSFDEENFDGNAEEEEVVGLNYPFTSNEENEYNVENSNNDVQYNLPVLMMPLRTPKSVKKTLDEFLKKENETKHQILNAEENRLKHSRSDDISEINEGFEKPIEEQLYIIPKSDLLKKMIATVSNKENCKIKRCYEKPTNENIPPYDQYDQQNVVICVCISESSHDPVSYDDELYRYPLYPSREAAEEFGQEVTRNGVGEARTSMYMSDSLKKPFMGLGSDKKIKKFYDEFNDQPEGGGSLYDSNEEQLLFYDN